MVVVDGSRVYKEALFFEREGKLMCVGAGGGGWVDSRLAVGKVGGGAVRVQKGEFRKGVWGIVGN